MARRRGNNEGCIYHRKDGRWCAQVSLSGRRLTMYGKTQKECRDWVKETITKIGNGLTFQGTQVTLMKFIETWLDGKELSRRPQTVRAYRSLVQAAHSAAYGRDALAGHPAGAFEATLPFQEGRGPGARTVQVIHMVMHAVLKQAVKEGILGRNPADAVDRPKVEVAERKILTEEQAQQLIIATTGTRYGTLIYMALMTGMREGELLGLKWSDVDWTKGQLHVQRQLQVHESGRERDWSHRRQRRADARSSWVREPWTGWPSTGNNRSSRRKQPGALGRERSDLPEHAREADVEPEYV